MKLAICILFYEKVDQTIECLKSLLTGPMDQVQIYVLNNGSRPESVKTLKSFTSKYANIHILDGGSNLGVSGGRNYLIKHTKEPWLWFLDNDIIVRTPDWYERFLYWLKKYPEMEVFIPVLYHKHAKEKSVFRPYRFVGDKVRRIHPHIYERKSQLTNNFPGGASFIKRTLFERNGLYDEKMFVGYEDFEYAIRALKEGKEVKAINLKGIYLVHDHIIVKTDADREAVKVRYDEEKHQISYDRIKEKHGVDLDEDFRPWLKMQKEKLLEGRSFWLHYPQVIGNYLKRRLKHKA